MIKNVSIQIYVFDTRKAWNRWLWKKTNLIVKEKCLREISIFQEMTKIWYKILKTPNKNHWQISLHIFAFENIPSTFYFFPPEKNTFY